MVGGRHTTTGLGKICGYTREGRPFLVQIRAVVEGSGSVGNERRWTGRRVLRGYGVRVKDS